MVKNCIFMSEFNYLKFAAIKCSPKNDLKQAVTLDFGLLSSRYNQIVC